MATTRWWETRWAIIAAVLAVAVPLLWPTIPPLLDLPSHMASYHVSVNLAHSPDLQRYFAFHWQLIGNLGVDLLVVPLVPLLGVEGATKLVVLLIPTLTALGFLLIAREAHGRVPPTAFAALPLAYNYPLMFGFVNYCLAVAIAMLGLALWLRWPATRRGAARAAVFAAIALACWLAHAIGWVMLGVMCGAAELQRRWSAGENVGRLLAGTTLACLPLLAPLVLMAIGPREQESSTSGWFNAFMIVKWAVTVLRDRWMAFDLASAAVLGALVCAAVARIGGLALRPALAWPAAALALLYVAAPQAIDGSYFVSARIVPYAVALAVLAIDTRALGRSRQGLLALAATAFLVVRLAGNLVSFALYDARYTRELAALDHIARGAAVLTFSGVPCEAATANWYNPRLYHLSGLAVVRRDAFVNATWGIAGLHTLRVRYAAAGAFQGDPSEMVFYDPCPLAYTLTLEQALRRAPLPAFQNLWLIGIPPARWPHDPRLVPVWSSGESVLYRIAAGAET